MVKGLTSSGATRSSPSSKRACGATWSGSPAAKVAGDTTAIAEADVEPLRAHGLSDPEIFDVILAAAARCFFSKAVDAVGVQPDAEFSELEAGLREALTVGRPIADG